MIRRIRIAVLAGVSALALAGCQRDGADAATGPTIRGAASGVVVPPAPPPDGGLAWTDAEGHVYSVSIAMTATGLSAAHFRDGVQFAESRGVGGGTNVSYFESGVLVQEEFVSITLSGPDSSVPLGGPGPQRAMMVPCGDAWSGYLLASAELIAAGLYMQRHPGFKGRAVFAAAVANFAAAWYDLYSCTR